MRKKILIVDDNTGLLKLLSLAVKDAGYNVATADTGPEALAKARTFKPDLLILDLILPEMDGFAVCETLRRDYSFSHMPIIMLTGLTSEFTRYAGLECGASEYVTKPASPAELVSKIERWLRTSEARLPVPAQSPEQARKARGRTLRNRAPSHGAAEEKVGSD